MAKDALDYIHKNYGILNKKVEITNNPSTTNFPGTEVEPEVLLDKGLKTLNEQELEELKNSKEGYNNLDSEAKKQYERMFLKKS